MKQGRLLWKSMVTHSSLSLLLSGKSDMALREMLPKGEGQRPSPQNQRWVKSTESPVMRPKTLVEPSMRYEETGVREPWEGGSHLSWEGRPNRLGAPLSPEN